MVNKYTLLVETRITTKQIIRLQPVMKKMIKKQRIWKDSQIIYIHFIMYIINSDFNYQYIYRKLINMQLIKSCFNNRFHNC